MRVRGLGQLKLRVDVISLHHGKCCSIANYDNADKSSMINMELWPKIGLDETFLKRIVRAAEYEGINSFRVNPGAPNVFLRYGCHKLNGIEYQPLIFQCKGSVEDVEGLLKRAAKILANAAKKVAG